MYKLLAEKRLKNEDVVLLRTKNGEFGFTCKHNYSGLMAQPSRTGKNKGIVKREKQGLYDIFINTGNRYGNTGVSHRNIIEDIINFSTENNCYRIWRGESPLSVANNDDELEVLTTLLLLFFEQELNWGKEDWQRFTYFEPKIRTPKRIRPRDMLMGYICQAFSLGVDNIAYWMTSRPTTTTFIAPDRSNYGFEDYDVKYKKYFIDLQNDLVAEALMTGKTLENFRNDAKTKNINPHYK